MVDTTPTLSRLLIVDDESLIVRMLHEVLKSRYLLQIAASGREALAMALIHSPELILLDVGLPDLDGYEVCRQLRGNRATRDIPVIFLTCHDSRKEVMRGFEAGGSDYVLKPFGVMELLARINHQLRQHRQAVTLEAALERNCRRFAVANSQFSADFELISGLLELQSILVDNEPIAHGLVCALNQVRIISATHAAFLNSDNLNGIEAGTLLCGIACRLVSVCGRNDIRLTVECDRITLGADTAAPCGLAVNELIGNALTHAFPDGRSGTVTLTLRREATELLLSVGDDGVGLPEGLNPLRSRTLGMSIVTTLVERIKGTLSLAGGSGTRFIIRFPASSVNGLLLSPVQPCRD